MIANPQEELRAEIAAAGLTPPAEITADGELHRFTSNGKRGDDAGWYVLYGDGVPAGAFGDWRSGISRTWRAEIGRELTPAEREAQRGQIEEAKRKRVAEEARLRAGAREQAVNRWAMAKPADPAHPYLVAKGVKPPEGIRQLGNTLLIPMRDADETLHNIERIFPDHAKKGLKHGRREGCYFAIGKPNGVICVTEGFATGASVHEATGHAVAVAFSAGNLRTVAEAIKTKYPTAQLIICADDDHRTDGNLGITKATEAARAVDGLLAVPEFGPDRPDSASDFNDLACHRRAEAVAKAVANARAPGMAKDQPRSTGGAVTDPEGEESPPTGFEVDDKDVWFTEDGDKYWLCSSLKVTALVRDRGQGNWGRLLEFTDPDGSLHTWAMPMELLRGGGDDLRGELLRQGLRIAPGLKARNKLAEYISASSPKRRARCVDKTGWYDGMFVLPDRTIGGGTELVLYQSETPNNTYSQAGTLDQWRRHVAGP